MRGLTVSSNDWSPTRSSILMLVTLSKQEIFMILRSCLIIYAYSFFTCVMRYKVELRPYVQKLSGYASKLFVCAGLNKLDRTSVSSTSFLLIFNEGP